MLRQVALRKAIRGIEKQLTKFQKQAEEWGEYGSVSGYSLEACGAGLAGVRGQLELARALREVHTQEVRQELAQFEAVCVLLSVYNCFPDPTYCSGSCPDTRLVNTSCYSKSFDSVLELCWALLVCHLTLYAVEYA